MDVYREEILDHFKNPRNFGEVDKMKVIVEERNASCGDVVRLGIKIKDKKIKEVRFEGEGCAISIAFSSVLTEMLKGKSINKARDINEEKMKDKLKIPISSARKKCATLGLVAWQKLQKNLI